MGGVEVSVSSANSEMKLLSLQVDCQLRLCSLASGVESTVPVVSG